jgi:hypothetical protein
MKTDLLAAIKVRLSRWFASKGQTYRSGFDAAWEHYEAVLCDINASEQIIMQTFAALCKEPREWPPSPGEIYQRIVEAASPTPVAEMAWSEAIRRAQSAGRAAPSHRLVDDAVTALGGYDVLGFEWSQGRPMVVRSQYLTAYNNLLSAWQAEVRRELALPRSKQRRDLVPDSPKPALLPWSEPPVPHVPALAAAPGKMRRALGTPMPPEVKAQLNGLGLNLDTLIAGMPKGDKS